MSNDDIKRALDDARLFLVLQPIVSTLTFQPMFYEALLRLRLSDGGIRPAVDFIEAVEGAGLIGAIDRRALDLVVDLLEQHPAFHVALNISSLTTSDFTWLRALDRLTSDRPGLTRRLTVEITETAAITDIDRTQAFVDALKEMGCRVAIDDYGAGHTNFTNLNLLAPDIVKIDRTYTMHAAHAGNERTFVEALIDLSRTLSFETVAEGVETDASAKALADLGVTYLQGYFFGEPGLPQDVLDVGQERS